MKKMNQKEMVQVKGGAGVSSAMINAIMRTVSVLFSIGQSVGSAIRRTVNGKYC